MLAGFGEFVSTLDNRSFFRGSHGPQGNHLQGRVADFRPRPPLLPDPQPHSGSPSLRDRRADDGALAGLCTAREADLLETAPDGRLLTWIDVGLPDERAVRKACHRAERVVVLTYGGKAVDIWWQQNQGPLSAHANLTVLRLPADQSTALAGLADRSMRLQCTVQEGVVWLGDEERSLELRPDRLLG